MKLWEANHPYYATEGNYYARNDECHTEYESWQDFKESEGDSDPNLNLLYRWDWLTPDPDDYGPNEEVPGETLALFWVGQRKAILRSTSFPVTRENEPEIRAWLTQRARTIIAIWNPILPEVDA